MPQSDRWQLGGHAQGISSSCWALSGKLQGRRQPPGLHALAVLTASLLRLIETDAGRAAEVPVHPRHGALHLHQEVCPLRPAVGARRQLVPQVLQADAAAQDLNQLARHDPAKSMQ